LIEVDIPARKLDIVGVAGRKMSEDEMERVLAERRKTWAKPKPRYTKGALGIYTKLAASPMKGGYMV